LHESSRASEPLVCVFGPETALSLKFPLILQVDSTANESEGIRNDLITLDSPWPLIEDPGDEEVSFEKTWQDLSEADNARGWYNDTMDKAVRRLQMLADVKVQVIESSLPPFVGE